jgi:hypothetical protein
VQARLLDGESAANRLAGWDGGDHLEGRAGDDFLDGESGTNELDGGDGTDTCANGATVVNCEACKTTPSSLDNGQRSPQAARRCLASPRVRAPPVEETSRTYGPTSALSIRRRRRL